MGWMERCFETYENNRDLIGVPAQKAVKDTGRREAPILLPVAHTTQKAHVEVNLSDDGVFQSAWVLRPDEMTTIIPCTEESGSRTSGAVPHPLADKLQYIAGDYKAFGGPKASAWEPYLEQLRAWCASPYSHPKVRAVLTYLEKGCLIADLVRERILYTDAAGHLLQKWDGTKNETPAIFGVLTGGDEFETFVRFRVGGVALAENKAVQESYIRYYLSTMQQTDFCYVQGESMPVSRLSPAKIRNAGDKAKLISSNDSQNFTYRGRFENAEQALSVGYETTQKAHNALRWLCGRQGVQNGDQTILVWGTENEPIPAVTADTLELTENAPGLSDLPTLPNDFETEKAQPTTREAFALQFKKAVQGYRAKLGAHSKITVMVLDSATPGRLSVRYYRELSGSRLVDCVEDWHRSFAWELRYRKVEIPQSGGKPALNPITFLGAPAPADIAKAAYGERVDQKLKQQTIERLLPCITEGRRFPRDLMLSAVHRASNSVALDTWEANKTRSIACALVRGYYHRNLKEDFSMAVQNDCNDRSYLFGRILAYAEQIEYTASRAQDIAPADRRPTNALRYEVAFTIHPAKTTALLETQLQPYLTRLARAGKSSYLHDRMLELMDRLKLDGFTNQPLSELYLLGYAAQRMEFIKKHDAENDAQSTVSE